jgi:hypothetical protein
MHSKEDELRQTAAAPAALYKKEMMMDAGLQRRAQAGCAQGGARDEAAAGGNFLICLNRSAVYKFRKSEPIQPNA